MKGFTKEAVGMFSGNACDETGNCNETGFTTVAKPPKVVCTKCINHVRSPVQNGGDITGMCGTCAGGTFTCGRQLDDLQQAPTSHAV